jgi:hypothetical protein
MIARPIRSRRVHPGFRAAGLLIVLGTGCHSKHWEARYNHCQGQWQFEGDEKAAAVVVGAILIAWLIGEIIEACRG